jgi:hypothetical protein
MSILLPGQGDEDRQKTRMWELEKKQGEEERQAKEKKEETKKWEEEKKREKSGS